MCTLKCFTAVSMQEYSFTSSLFSEWSTTIHHCQCLLVHFLPLSRCYVQECLSPTLCGVHLWTLCIIRACLTDCKRFFMTLWRFVQTIQKHWCFIVHCVTLCLVWLSGGVVLWVSLSGGVLCDALWDVLRRFRVLCGVWCVCVLKIALWAFWCVWQGVTLSVVVWSLYLVWCCRSLCGSLWSSLAVCLWLSLWLSGGAVVSSLVYYMTFHKKLFTRSLKRFIMSLVHW